MSASRTFEIEDREYEVHTSNFHPGSHGSYWDPPDPPEWEGENIVDVTFYTEDDQVRLEDYVTFDTFVREYAAYHDMSFSDAESAIADAMIEACMDHYREMDE